MRVIALGDLHHSYVVGITLAKRAGALEQGTVVVQVGDLGWDPKRPPPRSPFKIHWIDGNHEKDLPNLLQNSEPTELAPGWIYCPRGSVLEFQGKRIGFLGGAKSIDRDVREWFEEEELTFAEAARLRNERVDLLVTHTPPSEVVQAMGFENPDRSAIAVQTVWEHLGRPKLVCGHLHRHKRMGRVLVLGDLDVDVLEI